MNKRPAFLLFLLFAIVISSPALARQNDLKAFTSKDGTLSFYYGADWQVQESDQTIIVGSSPSAVDHANNNRALNPGEFYFGIIPPAALAQFDLPLTADATAALNAIMTVTSSTGQIQPYTSLDVPAEQAVITGGSIGTRQALVIAAPLTEGTVVVVFETGDKLTTYGDLVAAFISTITYHASGSTATAEATSAAGNVVRQWGAAAAGTSQFGGSSDYGFVRATGAPDTTDCGDHGTAWASQTPTGKDILTITFAQPVIPTQINIYQTFNPGSIIWVGVSLGSGQVQRLQNSSDAPGATPCPGIFTLNISGAQTAVDTITIGLDQSIGGNWDEIDAVELVGTPPTTEVRQWATSATGTSQYGETDWSFAQATGAPNTADCGDHGTAWASETSGGRAVLIVSFDQPVIPTQINIYQTFNPGSIVAIDLGSTTTGDVVHVPNASDPPGNTPCPGVFTLNLTGATAPVSTVAIYLDQSIGGSWDEIDAVELVGTPAGGKPG